MTKEATSSVQREAPTDETTGLESRIDAVEKQGDEISAALVGSRMARLGILLGFLVLVCVTLYYYYGLIDQFRSEENLNRMTEMAQAHLDENADRYLGEVKKLVDHSYPVLKDAFLEQAKTDTPKYTAAIEKQRGELLTNLSTRIEGQVTTHYDTILKRHRRIINEEFPDLTDEQLAMVALNLEKAAKRLVEKYYVDRMSGELEAMYQTWDQFPVAEEPGPNDPPLEDQLVGFMMELMITLASSERPSLIEGN